MATDTKLDSLVINYLTQAQYNNAKRISIHALLAESDSKSAQNSGALLRI